MGLCFSKVYEMEEVVPHNSCESSDEEYFYNSRKCPLEVKPCYIQNSWYIDDE